MSEHPNEMTEDLAAKHFCPLSMGRNAPARCLGGKCMAWVLVSHPLTQNGEQVWEGRCGMVSVASNP